MALSSPEEKEKKINAFMQAFQKTPLYENLANSAYSGNLEHLRANDEKDGTAAGVAPVVTGFKYGYQFFDSINPAYWFK